jgi:hypothetical protein
MKLGAGMNASKESQQQIAMYAGAVVLALIVLGLGYFITVRPANAKAAVLNARVVSLRNTAESDAAHYKQAVQLSKVQLADLFDLTRAMPDQTQMADILVVLGRVAANSNVEFDSISPTAAVPLAGYEAVPMSIQVQGRFYDLMEFLYELRHLVDVRADKSGAAKLYATGRLFTVNKIVITLQQTSDPNKPELSATINLDAFQYGLGTGAPGATTPSATPGATTTSTDTTSTSTTTTAGSASAAGAPAGGTG